MKKVLLGLSLVGSLYSQTFTKSLDSVGWHNFGVPLDNIDINSTTFSDNISVIWRWNELTQSWEFYSNNDSLKELAQNISIPIITKLNKGDAIWVKNSGSTSLILDDEKEFVPNGSCTEEIQGVDTRVVKIGSVGQILSDESEEWSGIWYKDPYLNIMLAFDRTPAGYSQTKSQTNANNYCKSLDFIGFDDWRLPSKEESQMMYYYYSQDETLIENQFKYSIDSYEHWTSSYYANYDYYSYYLNSSNSHKHHKSNDYKFLCVRTAN